MSVCFRHFDGIFLVCYRFDNGAVEQDKVVVTMGFQQSYCVLWFDVQNGLFTSAQQLFVVAVSFPVWLAAAASS